jgi:hypothetical protein
MGGQLTEWTLHCMFFNIWGNFEEQFTPRIFTLHYILYSTFCTIFAIATLNESGDE